MELLAVSMLTVLVKMIAICRSLPEGKKKNRLLLQRSPVMKGIWRDHHPGVKQIT